MPSLQALALEPHGLGRRRRMGHAPDDTAPPGRRVPEIRPGVRERVSESPQRLIWSLAALVAAAVGLYLVLPEIAGLEETWGRLSEGDPIWIGVAAVFELGSYAAYVLAFHRLFALPGSRIGWRESYDISLAGVAATRLLALAGAGGIVLSAWALTRSGMARQEVARRLTTFYVALYAVFMVTLVLAGTGLRIGLLSGPAPFGLTVVPAIFGGLVIAAALLAARLPSDLPVRAAPACSDARASPFGSRRWRRGRPPSRRGCGGRSSCCATATARCSGRSAGGPSTSPSSGPASTPSASRRRSGSW